MKSNRKPTDKEKLTKILSEAIEALYFDDGNDYGTYLWKIIEIAGGEEACDLLESSPQDAYEKYCDE